MRKFGVGTDIATILLRKFRVHTEIAVMFEMLARRVMDVHVVSPLACSEARTTVGESG